MKNSHTSSQSTHSTHSDPAQSYFQKAKANKLASISIFKAQDLDPIHDICQKDNVAVFPNILPQLKFNEPTPTFQGHDNTDAVWDYNTEELKIENAKNGKLHEFDEFGNISVIEKENVSGLAGISGDMPAFFDSKVSEDNCDNSVSVAEAKAEVINGDDFLNMSSFVLNGNQNDLSVLPEHNETLVMEKRKEENCERKLKKNGSGSKVKPVKIGKIQLSCSPQFKTKKNLGKVVLLGNELKPHLKSESSSSKALKPINKSQVHRSPVLNLSTSSKKFPSQKTSSKPSFSSSYKTALSPLAASLIHNPYLQEFKKTVLTSLIPSKKPSEEIQSTPMHKSIKKKKRIQIF